MMFRSSNQSVWLLAIAVLLMSCDDEAPFGECDGGKYDGENDLCWQDPPNETGLCPNEAVAYCDGLVLAGHEDWRLPEFDELYSIMRGCSKAASVENAPNENGESCNEFQGPSEQGCYWNPSLRGSCELTYWSATLYGSGYYQWYVDFSVAFWDCNEFGPRFVRCVRDEK